MKNHDKRFSEMLCVEFPQVQHIDLSELIHVLKAVAIVTSALMNLSTSGQSLFLLLRCPLNGG